MRGEVRPERRTGGVRAWGGGDASGMCTGRARPKAVGVKGTRGAHVEHVAHVRDLGGVEAERLVERVRVLPSRKDTGLIPGEVLAGRSVGVGCPAVCTGRIRLCAQAVWARAPQTSPSCP